MKYVTLFLLISCRMTGAFKDSIFIIPTEFGVIQCEKQHSTKEFLNCTRQVTNEKIASVQIGDNTIVLEQHKEDL